MHPRSLLALLAALCGAPPACSSDGGSATDARPAPAPDAEVGDAAPPPDGSAPDSTPTDAYPPDAAAPPDAEPCNGAAALCDRPYNEVAQACTHNAMSSEAYRFIIPKPNQALSLTAQLDAGVRCLMLDTYRFEGELYLCHGACGNWGKLRLSAGLDEISAWLAAHPRDVVTFILESYISEAETLSGLAAAGLAAPDGAADPAFPLFHAAGGPGTPWPTLGEMVEANRRLVVFTDDAAATAAWHLHWPSWGWETPYNDPDFTCAHGRGTPGGNAHPVFILNHYSLGPAGGDTPISAANNTFDRVLEHARRCTEVTEADNPLGLAPTFVNVDHVEVPTEGGGTDRPDTVDAVDVLNGLRPPP